jgi:hypothetical protein
MKRAVLSLLFFVTAGLVAVASSAFAQDTVQLPVPPLNGYYTYGKLRGVSTEEAMRGAAAATTIPMWQDTVTASADRGGASYPVTMVGRSPFFRGARTTNIPIVIIPVKFVMTDHDTGASTFDPTATDTTCSPNGSPLSVFENSPILVPVDFTMPFGGGVNVGSGQYADEFQRANFWQNVSVTGDSYHTTLSPTTLAVQSVPVPSGHGKGYLSSDFGSGFCGSLGGLDGSWWDPVIFGEGSGGKAQALIASLTTAGTIKPTQFPIFLFYNVILNVTGESACQSGCALGYHNSQGSPVQTYAVADWDTTRLFTSCCQTTGNSSVASHEVAEWMDDPLGSNPAPSWGHIGQVSGCQTTLEVGDPLSGTIVPQVLLNGMNYDLQELAFFSWFYGPPSIAVDSTFSNNGTFSSDAGTPCT